MDVVRFYTLKDLLYRWQIEDSVFVCNYRLYLYVLAVFVGCTEISVLIHFAVNCNFHYRRPPTRGDFCVRSLLVGGANDFSFYRGFELPT